MQKFEKFQNSLAVVLGCSRMAEEVLAKSEKTTRMSEVVVQRSKVVQYSLLIVSPEEGKGRWSRPKNSYKSLR